MNDVEARRDYLNVDYGVRSWLLTVDHKRIALLYLDLDNYEGTLACLRNLYPLVSPGGVVAFDEYALAGYGESDAVDEFFRGQKIRLRSFPWAKTPMAFLVKEAA